MEPVAIMQRRRFRRRASSSSSGAFRFTATSSKAWSIW